MKKKTKVLLSSLLAIGMSASLATGATYALFTSESTVNVAVTSGTVSVSATAENLVLGSTLGENLAETSATIVDGNRVELVNFVPGDYVTFDLKVVNNSNVAVKYQTVVSLVEGVELFTGLEVTVDDVPYDGMTAYSNWVSPIPNEYTVPVKIALPESAGNEYQGLSTTIAYRVNAVQGNANLANPPAADENTQYVYTAEDMELFARQVNGGNTFEDKTVVLMDDIVLDNASTFALRSTPTSNWTPIGSSENPFKGTFDGNNKTIKNLVSIEENYAGVFGYMNDREAMIKNLTVENPTVVAKSHGAAIVGYAYTGAIKNCHVKGLIQISGNYMLGGIAGQGYAVLSDCTVAGTQGSYIKAEYLESNLEGDKVGGLVGHIAEGNKSSNCSVSGVAIEGTRTIGGAFGYATSANFTDISVKNVTVTSNASEEYGIEMTEEGKMFVGGIVGEFNGSITGSISNATITSEYGITGAVYGGTRNESATISNGAKIGDQVRVNDGTYAYNENKLLIYTEEDSDEVVLYSVDAYTGSMENFVVPDGVTELNGYLFSDSSLKNITIPSTVKTIGNRTFKNCKNLTSVEIPDSVTTIAESAFQGAGITSVTLRDDVTYGNTAFRSCENLTTVVIPEGVQTLPDGIFRDCYALESVVIPSSVTSIGYRAFYDCAKLATVTIESPSFTMANQVFNKNNFNIEGFCGINIYVVNEAMKKVVEDSKPVVNHNKPVTITVNRDYTEVTTPVGNTAAQNGQALADAINATTEEAFLNLGAGEYKMPSVSGSKEVTIVGTKDTVIDNTMGSYMDSSTVSFEGVTIKGSTGKVNGNGSDYAALYCPNVTYTNCTFDGPFRIGRDGAKFINCTFTNLGNDYVWTYGNDVEFIGCTFETDGKAILIYSDGGNEVSKVTVKNCTFTATQGAKAGAIANQNCAAIEIHNYGNGVNLTTSGNTYDSNFSGEWRIKTYETGRTQVIVNGTEYTTIALDGKTMTIDANKNVTVQE